MRQITRMAALVLLMALASSPLALCADVTLDGLLIAGFESADELALWKTRALTDLALTDAWSVQGKSAAAITYHQWSAGKEEWPAIIANLGQALPTGDFTPFELLRFTAFNPGDLPAEIKLHIAGRTGARYSQIFSVPAKQALPVQIPVGEIGASIDVANVATLHFFVTRPERTYTVYVDDLRLTVDVADNAEALLADIAGLQAQVSKYGPGVAHALPPVLQRKLDWLYTLAGQTRRVLEAATSDGLKTWDAVKDARARLVRIRREFEGTRLVLPRLAALQAARKAGADQFVLATETSMQKVFIEQSKFASAFGNEYELSCARNEHESFQVIVVPVSEPIADVRWSATRLHNDKGASIPASVRLVGYVKTKQPSYPVPFNGWWPDPLLDFMDSVPQVPADEVLPLWVTVSVPEDAAAGVYSGQIKVSAAGAKAQTVDVRCRVRNFAIPKNTHLRTALSWRGHLGALYPEDQVADMTRKYHDWMLEEYHLNPNNIYAAGPPTEWDVARLKDLMGKGLNAINLAYFNAPREPDFNSEAYWKSFDQRVQWIKGYLPVVDAAGARDLCFIYCFDERPSSQLDVVFETAEKLKEIFPDIETMTTAYDTTFGMNRDNGHFMDIWVPLTPHFDTNAANIAKAREKGRDIWWYICIGPKHPYANWFVEWPAIEARLLMGVMTAKYNPGGFLYYAVNRWPNNTKVITGGPRTDWDPASFQINNGDGSIMCAGPNGPLATIRLENIRDGIEDYEYNLLLRDLLRKKGKSLDAAEVAPSVVQDLSHFTYDPRVLYAERERMARLIEELGR